MDNSGSRFLERFAGSGDFENRLNRSRNTRRDYRDAPGDFTRDGNSNEFNSEVTSQLSDTQSPSSGLQTTTSNNRFFSKNQHSAENGVYKNKSPYSPSNDQFSSQGDIDGAAFVNRYASINRNIQKGKSDGSSIANKYIQSARDNNPFDVVEMDRQIRKSPLYHEAKSELEGLKLYGDRYRNARENLPNWNNPESPEEIEKPDFEAIYDKTKADIDSIDI